MHSKKFKYKHKGPVSALQDDFTFTTRFSDNQTVKMGLIAVPKEAEGSARPAILMGAFVAFGGILFGYDTGTISGILAMGQLKFTPRLLSN